jgi:hypothetical protein
MTISRSAFACMLASKRACMLCLDQSRAEASMIHPLETQVIDNTALRMNDLG